LVHIFFYSDANYDKSAKWILSLEDDRALRSKLALQVFSQYGKRETPLHDSLLVAQSRRHDGKSAISVSISFNLLTFYI